MRSDWILDVLADLRSFADANDLPLLAEQLDDTALTARAEIASKDERSASSAYVGDVRQSRVPVVSLGAVGQS